MGPSLREKKAASKKKALPELKMASAPKYEKLSTLRGLSEKETSIAKDNNIALAGLGKRILRTETASGYVLSAISVLLED